MNKNFLKTTFPQISTSPTHFVAAGTPYIVADFNSFPPMGKIERIENIRKFDNDVFVVLLEYGLGYKASWSKVIIYNANEITLFYIESLSLEPLQEIKQKYFGTERYPSYVFPINPEKEYQPDEYSVDINWKEQQRNVVYEDRKNGKFSVHYETDITEFNSEEQIRHIIREACYKGTSLILKEKGFRYDIEYVKSIVNNYYIFSRAEEHYFPLRPCSTFRVLVTLPSRILYAKDLNEQFIIEANNDRISESTDLPSSEEYSAEATKDEPPPDLSSEQQLAEEELKEEDKNLIVLKYKNKDELDLHFAFILLHLAWFQTTFLFPPGRLWRITPEDVKLDLLSETARLGKLYKLINEFIYKNLHQNVVLRKKDDEGAQDFKDVYKEYTKAKPSDLMSISDLISFTKTTALPFNGELQIIIDKTNLVLKEIKLFSDREIHTATSLQTQLGIAGELAKPIAENLATAASSDEFSQFSAATQTQRDSEDLFNTFQQTQDFIESSAQQQERKINYKQIVLNIDSTAFYKNDLVLDKTSLNYLINITPPKDFLTALIPQIEELSKSNDINGFGKFVGGVLTSIDTILAGTEYLLGEKDQSLEKFLQDNHYPEIYSVYAEPIDFGACKDKLGDTSQNRFEALKEKYNPEKKLKQINKFKSDVEKYKKENANLFVRSLTDINSIEDENFKTLIGKNKFTENFEPEDELRRFIAACKMLDLPRFLNEAIKCSSAKFDTERWTNITNDYEKLKTLIENPDLLLLCNPIATKVQSILDQIMNFSLPEIPIYDPQQSLANELKKMVVKLINDLVVFAIRAIITGAIRDCTRDNNPDNFDPTNPNSPSNNNANNIGNNIDNAGNTREIDAFFNDYFNLDDQMQTAPEEEKTVVKNLFKTLLKLFLSDVTACLTTKELCVLLTGGLLEQDAYDVIFSILRRKYDTPQNKFNLAAKLNSVDEISAFFKKIRRTYNLRICEDVVSDSPIIPANPLCDDGRKETRERALLEDKGMPEDLIDDLLNDMKEKDEENLRDLLDYLNKPNPFDLNDIPTVLCKKGPNGEIIPPLVSLSPPVKSFNAMMDSMYDQVYNAFDEDAKTWYKNTYSVSSSSPKDTLKFDDLSGKLVIDNNKFKTTPSDKAHEEKVLPSYIFKDLLTNNLITQSIDSTEAVLNGHKEQILELTFVDQQMRKRVEKVYSNLKEFAESLIYLLDTYKLIVTTSGEINNFSDKGELNNFLQNEFSVFLKFLGTFYINCPHVINDSDKNGMVARVLNFKDYDYANALFAEDKPISMASYVMNYIVNNDSFKNNLKNTISALKENLVEETAISSLETLNISYKDPSEFLEDNSELITSYKKFYNIVSSYKKFSVAEGVLNSYPSYNINLKNIGSTIKKSEKTNRLELYDNNKFTINKNGYDFISRNLETAVDNIVLVYLSGTLKYTVEEINSIGKTKKEIFDSFIEYSKTKFPNSIHTSSLDFSLTTKDQKIFDDFGYLENANSMLEANYLGIKNLLNKQLDNNILSSPFLNVLEPNIQKPSTNDTKDPDATGKGEKAFEDLKVNNKSNLPITQYMTLIVNQTSLQKNCNIRPHYLDIDSIKSEAAKAKEESYCLEEAKSEKIKKGEEITSNELAKIELNDTQYIMLDGAYRLSIRTYLHEIMLRAISIYGAYDPQTIRKNEIFISIMTDVLESELRAKDNTLFLMMVSFFAKLFKFKNPQLPVIPSYKTLLKQVVADELKNNVLPKLSKRIYEDTNQRLGFLNPPLKASLTTIHDFYREKNNILFIDPNTKSVYIRVTGTKFKRTFVSDILGVQETALDFLATVIAKQNNALLDADVEALKYSKQEIYFQKIYESSIQLDITKDGADKIKSEIIKEFSNSAEYKLLFKFLFPLEDELVFRHFAAVFGIGTKKETKNAFITTKKLLALITKLMATNGIKTNPDPNNFQDLENNDQSKMFIKFIIDALITAPLKIVKGFTETTEPNIALSSKLYMLTKLFVPETPSFLIPAISLPLGLSLYIPWVNIPLAAFYLGAGLWYESDNGNDPFATDLLKNLVDTSGQGQAEAKIDCSRVTNPDRIQTSILYDGDPGYNFLNPSSDFALNTDEQIKAAKKLIDEQNKQNRISSSGDRGGQAVKPDSIMIGLAPSPSSQNEGDSSSSTPQKQLLIDYIKETLSFPDPYNQQDENQASNKGGVYYDVWLFSGKPSSYLALEQILDTKYQESGPVKPFRDWLKDEIPGINFFDEQ